MARYGYAFESEIGSSLYALDQSGEVELFYEKLVDTHAYDRGVWCPHCRERIKSNMMTPKCIADFVVVWGKSHTTFIECKSSRNERGLPIRNVARHQREFSLRIEYFGVPYWFVLNDRRVERHYKAYAIRAFELDDWIATRQKRGIGKYLPWNEMEIKAMNIERVKGQLWDLKPLFAGA